VVRHPGRWAAAGLLLAVAAVVAATLNASGRVDLVDRLTVAARPGAAAAPAARAEPPAVPRRLTVTTRPSHAALRVLRDGVVVAKGTTPFTGTVTGGNLTLTLARQGYNSVSQRLVLDKDQKVSMWLDPEGQLHHELGTFKTGSAPKQVAFTPDGREIWVTLLGGPGVEVFSAATRKRLARIKLGSHGSVEVIFNRAGTRVYVSQMETASVYEIDRVARKVLRRLPTKGTWTKVITLSPDERTLYAANWSSNDVSEIELGSGKVRRRLDTVATPRGLYVTPDSKRLYVAGYEQGELQRFDLASGRAKVLLRTGGAIRHLVGDADGAKLYADDMAKSDAWVVDLATERVRKLGETDAEPNSIDLSPDGRVLYVSNRGRNGSNYYLPGPEWGSVLAVDTGTGRYLDAIVGGNQTTGLDVSPDGRLLAFSDFLDNRVTVYAVPVWERLAAGGGGRAGAHRADLAK
jgi:DNA-binding beta-propeller fold protein YncE